MVTQILQEARNRHAKEWKGKPSFFLLPGPVNSNPAVRQRNKGRRCFSRAAPPWLRQCLWHRHLAQPPLGWRGQLELGLRGALLAAQLPLCLCRPGTTPPFPPALSLGTRPVSQQRQRRPSGQHINHRGSNCTAQNREFVLYRCYSFSYFYFLTWKFSVT